MKTLKAVAMVVFALTLTSCLDIVHSVSEDEGGYSSRFRITVSKSIFQLAESFGGEESTVPDAEMNQELGLDADQIREELPAGLQSQVREINTKYDVGIDVTVASANAEADVEQQWLPMRTDEELSIPLFPSQEEVSEGTESSQEADVFLAGRKYRIILSKGILPENPVFSLQAAGRESRETVEVIELQEVYLIELPLVAWLEAPGARLVVRRS